MSQREWKVYVGDFQGRAALLDALMEFGIDGDAMRHAGTWRDEGSTVRLIVPNDLQVDVSQDYPHRPLYVAQSEMIEWALEDAELDWERVP